MKKILLFGLISLMVVLIVPCVQAQQLELVGGIRDGVAVGVMAETNTARNLGLRYGIEANTGTQPVIAFIGGKFYLNDFRGELPLSIGMGLVGYFGEKETSAGLSLSVIINRAFNLQPLFIEAGVDAVGKGRLLLQIGYKIF